jgi:hypothetical protein
MLLLFSFSDRPQVRQPKSRTPAGDDTALLCKPLLSADRSLKLMHFLAIMISPAPVYTMLYISKV